MGICNASRVEVNNVVNNLIKTPSSNNNNKLNGSSSIENMGTSVNTPQIIIKANKIKKKYKKKKAEEDLIDEIFNKHNNNSENNKKYISIITKKNNINHHYIIHYDKVLGHGLTSKVYLAKKNKKINCESSSDENSSSDNDNKEEQKYAIKVINKNSYNNNNLLQNEILISLFLNHPGVVKTYEIFEDEEKIYFVMEYINGLTLGEFITKYKLNIKIIKKILYQILNTMTYLHNNIKVCHRDLKSNNIMIYFDKNKDIKIKIIDFGFSCYIKNNNKMNEILGTINYSAPEIIKGCYNYKIDIWSIGIILIDMLLGYNYYEKKFKEFIKNNNKDKDIINQNKYKYLSNIILNENIIFEEITNDENLKKLLSLLLNKNPKKRINAIDALEFIDQF